MNTLKEIRKAGREELIRNNTDRLKLYWSKQKGFYFYPIMRTSGIGSVNNNFWGYLYKDGRIVRNK